MAIKRSNIRKKGKAYDIASERVEILINKAIDEYKLKNVDLAQKLVKMAKKIQMKYRVKLKKELNLNYCKQCYIPWVTGDSVSVRIDSQKKCISYECICGMVRRLRYK